MSNNTDDPVAYPSIPTPTNKKPKPALFKPLWPMVTGLIGTAVVAGGSFFGLVRARPTATLGGTRTCRLKWEERQREIQQAVTVTEEQKPSTPSTPAPNE